MNKLDWNQKKPPEKKQNWLPKKKSPGIESFHHDGLQTLLPSDGNTMGLTIANPDNLKETMLLEKELSRVNGLRVVLTGGDARGGTFMCILIDRPIDLPGILNKMPMVGAVSGSGKRLLVSLKSYNS